MSQHPRGSQGVGYNGRPAMPHAQLRMARMAHAACAPGRARGRGSGAGARARASTVDSARDTTGLQLYISWTGYPTPGKRQYRVYSAVSAGVAVRAYDEG